MTTTIGFSLFAIALGAILRYAVTAHADGINLATVGLILIVVGGIGLVLGVAVMVADRQESRHGGFGSDPRGLERSWLKRRGNSRAWADGQRGGSGW